MRATGPAYRSLAGSLGLVLLAAGTASAGDRVGQPSARRRAGTIGVAARLGLGARGIATYDNDVYCGDTDAQAAYGYASVCTGRSPLALDLEGSYALTPTLEVLLELRVGLETDVGATPGASGPRPFHLAPGARVFFSDDARTRLFVQPELVLDLAGYTRGKDLGVRVLEGVWFDVRRSFSASLYVAESLAFSRWLYAAFEVGVGGQWRFR